MEVGAANPLRRLMSSLNSGERAFCYVSAELGLISDEGSTIWGLRIRLRTLNILCFILISFKNTIQGKLKVKIKGNIPKLIRSAVILFRLS